MAEKIDLIDFKNKDKRWYLNGEGIYLPSFKTTLGDFLIRYGALITDDQIQGIVTDLDQSITNIIMPTLSSEIPKLISTQNAILDLLKNDYKAVKPWLFYDWTNIPEAYIDTALQAHYNNETDLSLYWKAGQTREYTGDDGLKVYFTIVDFNHDTLTTPINGHTKSAISLFVTTNHTLTPGACYSYNDDYSYGFSYAVGTDQDEFVLFLNDNNVSTTYFNNATKFKSVTKDVYGYYDRHGSKIGTLDQQIQIPDFFDIFNQRTIDELVAYGNSWSTYQDPMGGIEDYVMNSGEYVCNPYQYFDKEMFGFDHSTFIGEHYNYVPYWTKHYNSNGNTYNTNMTMRCASSTSMSGYNGSNSTRWACPWLHWKLGSETGSITTTNQLSDYGVLIINI